MPKGYRFDGWQVVDPESGLKAAVVTDDKLQTHMIMEDELTPENISKAFGKKGGMPTGDFHSSFE